VRRRADRISLERVSSLPRRQRVPASTCLLLTTYWMLLSVNPAWLSALGSTTNLSAVGLLASSPFSNSVNQQLPMRPDAAALPFGGFGTPIRHSRWTVGGRFLPDLLSSSKWEFRNAPGVAGASYGSKTRRFKFLPSGQPNGLLIVSRRACHAQVLVQMPPSGHCFEAEHGSNPAFDGAFGRQISEEFLPTSNPRSQCSATSTKTIFSLKQNLPILLTYWA